LAQAAGWLEHYRPFWEDSFDRMANYLDELNVTEKEKSHGRKA
jgi:hypothetical protein